MPYEVAEPTIELHEENRFHKGDLYDVFEEEGNFGRQLKWVIRIDDDGTYTDDNGIEHPRETWTWSSPKLTTHENNRFRKFVKGLTGKEPVKGELFDERHYTRRFYDENRDADPVALTGTSTPWRVAVMFQHAKKQDGTPTEKVALLVAEAQVS